MATVEERKLTFEHNNDLVRDVYNIDYWGIGYFGVNDDGEMYVCPNPQQKKSG
ncbi:hypothetical protein [Spirabiliibacterium mucosae]|uniref:hypothetical protein n=1 Tax=Spirabiliibacterium mucosae TaxID=28156 RepID=UPI001F38FEEF|nr:hypothetical protein [Spirabiliibacterium mucosae]